MAVLKPSEITTEKSTTEMYVYLTLIEYLWQPKNPPFKEGFRDTEIRDTVLIQPF